MNPTGHAQYLAFLRIAGDVFSPLTPLPEPLLRGGHGFWSVEGLWQASKVVRLADAGRVASAGVQFEVLQQAPGATLVWFPAAGRVREDFKRSVYFAVLKSGQGHNAARNRWLGLGNWAFAGHYLADEARIVADRRVAYACIHRAAYAAQLAVHAEALVALRGLLADGVVAITEAMIAAHPHLGMVCEALAAQAAPMP